VTITGKTIRDNWMILSALAVLCLGAAKLKWTVDALDVRVTKCETRLDALEQANFIRQGAAEVWRARGMVGPPAPAGAK